MCVCTTSNRLASCWSKAGLVAAVVLQAAVGRHGCFFLSKTDLYECLDLADAFRIMRIRHKAAGAVTFAMQQQQPIAQQKDTTCKETLTQSVTRKYKHCASLHKRTIAEAGKMSTQKAKRIRRMQRAQKMQENRLCCSRIRFVVSGSKLLVLLPQLQLAMSQPLSKLRTKPQL